MLKDNKYLQFQAYIGYYEGMTICMNDYNRLTWNNGDVVQIDDNLIHTKWRIVIPMSMELKIIPIQQLYAYAVA